MASDQHWPAGMAKAEWRAHWPLVVTSMLAYAIVAIASVTVGAFLGPLEKAFGWTRAEATGGLLVYSIVSILGQPLIGRLIDHWGARRVALTGIIASGTAFALFATTDGSLIAWWLLWLFYGITAQFMLMPTWSAAVASEFEAGRGLALAVALSGSSLATFSAPLIATLLIEAYGWRTAYVAMGVIPSAVVLILAWFFFYSRSDRLRASGDRAAVASTMTGATVGEGFRSPTFYKLLFGTLFSYSVMVGVLVHVIPILDSTGLSKEEAAIVAGSFGITTVLGKLGCGALVNRVPGHVIAAVNLSLPIITFVALMTPSSSLVLRILAMAPLGLALGGQLKMVVYMTTRHFGLRAFGSIFGFITIGLTASSGAGPWITSFLFDLTGSYQLLLTIGIPVAVLGSLVMLSIGGYPDRTKLDAVGASQPSAA